MKKSVEVIRGNCDTSDFEDLLEFEMYDDDTLYINVKFVSITHGHIYNSYHLNFCEISLGTKLLIFLCFFLVDHIKIEM